MGGGGIENNSGGVSVRYGITYWAGSGTGDYVIRRPDGHTYATNDGCGHQYLQREIDRLREIYAR